MSAGFVRPHEDDTPEPRIGLLSVMRRFWWLLVLCTAVCAAAAGGISALQQKQYEATAKLLFQSATAPSQSLQSVFNLPTPGVTLDPNQEEATNIALLSVSTVADLTAQALRQVSSADVQQEVSVSEVGQSNVVSVTATDPSPLRAAAIANTFAQQFVAFRQNTDRAIIEAGVQRLQRQLRSLPANVRAGATGHSLLTRIQELSAIAGVQTGNAELVQSASPPRSPSLPRTKLNVLGGGLIGLILGGALALLLYRFSDRLRTPEELSKHYELPLLGVVPRTSDLKAPSTMLGPETAEAFRAIRARIRHVPVRRDLRSLLVTSASQGEGKSTIAWHLAGVMAMNTTEKVLVIESDLRRPVLARRHGLREGPGLAALLSKQLPLEAVIQEVTASDLTLAHATHNGRANGSHRIERASDSTSADQHAVDADGVAVADTNGHTDPRGLTSEPSLGSPPGRFDVIVAGAVPRNPSELLDSDAFTELLRCAQERYAFVIVDAPPGDMVSDTLPLVRQTSGVLLVSSTRDATVGEADWLRGQLDQAHAPLVGIVANNVASWRLEHRYAHYHAQNGKSSQPPCVVYEPESNGMRLEAEDLEQRENQPRSSGLQA